MNLLFENSKLALYLNLTKYLDHKNIPFRIAKDIVMLENDTIMVTIENRDKYAILRVSDIIMEAKWEVTIDIISYSLPTRAENSPFGSDIDYHLKLIRDNRIDKREEVFGQIVKKYGLVPKYENIPNKKAEYELVENERIYGDSTSTLFAARLKDEEDLSILIIFKEKMHEVSMVFSTVRLRNDTIMSMIDDISIVMEGYR